MDDQPVSKPITTLNLGGLPKLDTSRQQMQWDELRSVFPIYLALAKHLQIEIPFSQGQRVLPEKAEVQLHNQVQTWLDAMDLKVQVHQLRHLLQMTTQCERERLASADHAAPAQDFEKQCGPRQD